MLAATSQETHWAKTLQEAATRLREQSYSAAVIDQFVLETDPEESDQVLEHLGTAYPVYINFAVTGMAGCCVRSVRHYIAGGAKNRLRGVPSPLKCIAK